jgi:hypothetical protein
MKDPKKAMNFLMIIQIINIINMNFIAMNLVTLNSLPIAIILGTIAFILLITTLYVGIKYT